MPCPIFISYARKASTRQAEALAAHLGSRVFLDTSTIEDGEQFPQALLNGVLDAHIVVIFATKDYAERRFCRLEMRLTLAGSDAKALNVVFALDDTAGELLAAMPDFIATQSWPEAEATERLALLVEQRLASAPMSIRQRLSADHARRLSAAFLEESRIPPPASLRGIPRALPPQAKASMAERFVGRAGLLRTIHRLLSPTRGAEAPRAIRVTASGGFGKTRLAIEYLHRYGHLYPGGIFWIDGAASSIEEEFWRVLRAIDPSVDDLPVMRARGKDVRLEVEVALRAIEQPALYIVDDIPEANHDADPPRLADFCPCLGEIAVLATSRQDIREDDVSGLLVDALDLDAAILVLTDSVTGSSVLTWDDWEAVVNWVGGLPIALDLLNRSLVLHAIAPVELLDRARAVEDQPSAIGELDRLRTALRGQVTNAVRGVTETFLLSFEKLDDRTKGLAVLLGQLAPAQIPNVFMDALGEEWKDAWSALHSRHFVGPGGEHSFGAMHPLIGEFLRALAKASDVDNRERVSMALLRVMTEERCRDPREWVHMELCRRHAEALFERGSATIATSVSCGNLVLRAAMLALSRGEFLAARRLQERVISVWTQQFGEDHSNTVGAIDSLAATLLMQGDYARARDQKQHVINFLRRVLGEDLPITQRAMGDLATILRLMGDAAEARRIERRLDVLARVDGEQEDAALSTLSHLAVLYRDQGNLPKARLVLEQLLEARRSRLGDEHPETLVVMSALGVALTDLGEYGAAQELHERVLSVRRRTLTDDHPSTLSSMVHLAIMLEMQGDLPAAGLLYVEALDGRKRVLGTEHPDTLWSMSKFAEILSAEGYHAKARVYLEHVFGVRLRVLGEEHSDTLATMNDLALTLPALGEDLLAQKLLERVVEIRARKLGE